MKLTSLLLPVASTKLRMLTPLDVQSDKSIRTSLPELVVTESAWHGITYTNEPSDTPPKKQTRLVSTELRSRTEIEFVLKSFNANRTTLPEYAPPS